MFLKKNDLLIEMIASSPEDYIFHNNVNLITIDSLGIQLYQEATDKTVDELDEDLIEYIKANIPETQNTVIVIERSMNLPN